MGQTMKTREVTLVVLNYLIAERSFLREPEKIVDLKLHEFHKNTFTIRLQLLLTPAKAGPGPTQTSKTTSFATVSTVV